MGREKRPKHHRRPHPQAGPAAGTGGRVFQHRLLRAPKRNNMYGAGFRSAFADQMEYVRQRGQLALCLPSGTVRAQDALLNLKWPESTCGYHIYGNDGCRN